MDVSHECLVAATAPFSIWNLAGAPADSVVTITVKAGDLERIASVWADLVTPQPIPTFSSGHGGSVSLAPKAYLTVEEVFMEEFTLSSMPPDDTPVADLDDSLGRISAMMGLETEFGIFLSDEGVEQCQTVGALVAMVKKKAAEA